MGLTKKESVEAVLRREDPGRFIYAPNYWQWFAHARNHELLPEEISYCANQFEVIRHLGLEVFSRNIYCDEQEYWFGGLSHDEWDNFPVHIDKQYRGKDLIIEKTYHTRFGELSERLRYIFQESTLVQEKFLIDDYPSQLKSFEEFLSGRHFSFDQRRYQQELSRIGDEGVIIAGEFYSPLKMLHIFLGPVNSTYLLTDHEKQAKALMDLHENAQLALVKQMVDVGVPCLMSMDNLDTMFHPPSYVEKYSASFYEKASRICHEKQATFFIHACGQQRDNLKLISGLGVDGLEGVAFPPIGDIQLDEALELTGESFIITGGITAIETGNLTTKKEVERFVKELFQRLSPFRHRFIFSASCNTAIDTSWEVIKYFRDAWENFWHT